jgi:hypothetical protein
MPSLMVAAMDGDASVQYALAELEHKIHAGHARTTSVEVTRSFCGLDR